MFQTGRYILKPFLNKSVTVLVFPSIYVLAKFRREGTSTVLYILKSSLPYFREPLYLFI